MSPRGQPAMSFGVPPFTRGVRSLAIATLVVSVLGVVGRTKDFISDYVAFTPALFWHGRVWTALTYSFLMPSPMDLIFGLLALWLVGAMLEQRWGTRRFVSFYFATAAIGAVATGLIGLVSPTVMRLGYFGNWSAIEGLVAATAVMMPDATFFLYFFPVQARLMLPISAGITLLFMLMQGWAFYLPQLFGLGAGVLLAGGVSPGRFFLRFRVWMIDRRMRRSKLRVVRGDDPFGGPRGSDKFLH